MIGNVERDNFRKQSASMPRPGGAPQGNKPEGSGSGKTEIMHDHPKPGMHTVKHADGETTEHNHVGHMLMTLHAKHADGEGGHMHVHPEGNATTHHVGADGMVEGPDEHEGPMEAGDHLAQSLSDEGGMTKQPAMLGMSEDEGDGL